MRILPIVVVLSFCAPAAAQVRTPLPVVQRLEPTSGPAGSEVTLNGRFFDDRQTVWLGDAQLEVVSRLPNRWLVRIPSDASSGDIEVRTARGNVRGPRFRVTLGLPAPRIASFAPSRGASGTEVVLRGTNFSPRLSENQVYLGAVPVVVRNATPTELTVIVPSGASSAPFRLVVTGAGEATSVSPFAIGSGLVVASFTPSVAALGTPITVRGSGFSRTASENRVSVGEQRARVVRSTQTELEIELARTASGPIRVEVRGRRAESATPIEVRSPPSIDSMEPRSGAAGTRVTLRGRNFGTDVRRVAARMGQRELVVRDLADDRVVVEIANGASSAPIEVTAFGLGPARSGTFRVRENVSIDDFSPRSGGPASLVTIRGRGFSLQPSENVVTLSGRRLEVVRVGTGQIQVRIPPNTSSGTLTVAVTHAGEARTTAPFLVVRVPFIESFSPAEGPPGTIVTIRGGNFGAREGLLTVRIGEAHATLRFASDTELRVAVPSDARTGPLHVGVALSGSASSARPFTVRTP